MIERFENVIVFVVHLMKARLMIRILNILKSARRFQDKLNTTIIFQAEKHLLDVSDDLTFASELAELSRLRNEIRIAKTPRQADSSL